MIRFTSTVCVVFIFSISLPAQEQLGYHAIRTDKEGNILPCYSDDLAKSYDHTLRVVWNFWDTMRIDKNGIPYYMNHQVWRSDFNDPRGIGGDQIQMALSAWHLLYQYTGDQNVKDNMRFMADYYLSHGLSPVESKWPDLPYPYNTLLYSGIYDGDMVIGKNYMQPDKAGSFGHELVELYKMMANENYPHVAEQRYLEAAVAIANTLAKHVVEGDDNNSPLPFKVNALTGEVGQLVGDAGEKKLVTKSSYTTNWSGTLELFLDLIQLGRGETKIYQQAFDQILLWMKKYPMQSNKWGPFFEDVPGWSDTQINAMTWARFIMIHQDLFPTWKSDVSKIIMWVYSTLANHQWKKYGVTAINEQTSYKVPGNSHTARQAADELLFASLTGDKQNITRAIRQLSWSTYWVDNDGKNQFPTDDVWLTDGYGDYIRHYLRAMAAMPALAPTDQDHILFSTSVIQQVAYAGKFNRFNSPVFGKIDKNSVRISYRTFDLFGMEIIRMARRPKSVLLDQQIIHEVIDSLKEGFYWTELERGGILTIKRAKGNEILIVE